MSESEGPINEQDEYEIPWNFNPRMGGSRFRERITAPRGNPWMSGSSSAIRHYPTIEILRELLYCFDRLPQGANTTLQSPPSPNYLQVLTMIRNLGLPHYHGGTDPLEANGWLQNLEKNFNATRCPDEFKKDIAVFYLDSDATNWWDKVEKNTEERPRHG